MTTKRKQRTTFVPSPRPHQIKLTPEDLQEFSLRRTTLNNAKFQALMVEEAFTQWTKSVRLKYDIPTPKFSIDPVTGVIAPQGERNNGG